MRALRTCDFCGDEPADAFEIVPPELEPTAAEQRRVLLCADCGALLDELLEPLLDRAGAGSTGGRPSEGTTGDERTGGGATGSGSVGDAEPTRGSGADGEDDRDPMREFDGREGGVTITGDPGPDEIGGDEGDGSDVRAGADAADADSKRAATGDEDGTSVGVGDPAGADADERPATAAEAVERAPRAYGKVLRLLGNREFPVARSEVEALIAGAYDLEDHEVEAVLEYAIERGELVVDGNELRRP